MPANAPSLDPVTLDGFGGDTRLSDVHAGRICGTLTQESFELCANGFRLLKLFFPLFLPLPFWGYP